MRYLDVFTSHHPTYSEVWGVSNVDSWTHDEQLPVGYERWLCQSNDHSSKARKLFYEEVRTMFNFNGLPIVYTEYEAIVVDNGKVRFIEDYRREFSD